MRRRPAFEPPRRPLAPTAAPPSVVAGAALGHLGPNHAAPPSFVRERPRFPTSAPTNRAVPTATLYQASPTSFGSDEEPSSGQHQPLPPTNWFESANNQQPMESFDDCSPTSFSMPMTATHAGEDECCLTPMPSLSTGHVAAKDPMLAASGYRTFMNLLTQDEDDDLELLQSAPTSSGKGPKRGGNYTHDEDVQLCKSWIEIGNDPITGNEQPSKTYWKRIEEHFHANRDFESSRTSNSLEHRWGIIQKDVMRFQGCYENVERRHRSGIPYKEHMMEANARFAKNDLKQKQCQFIHCWLILLHTEKFASLELNKRPSKSSSTNDVLDLTTGGEDEGHGQETSSMPPSKRDRPPGRKESKEKQKKRSNEGQEDEVMGAIVNLLQAKAESTRDRLHVSSSLEERRLRIEERRLDWKRSKRSCSAICPRWMNIKGHM